MCFMDDQVKLGPCGGKGRLGIASAGDGVTTMFFWGLSFIWVYHLFVLCLLFKSLRLYQRKMQSLCQKHQNPRSPLSIERWDWDCRVSISIFLLLIIQFQPTPFYFWSLMKRVLIKKTIHLFYFLLLTLVHIQISISMEFSDGRKGNYVIWVPYLCYC